MHLAILIPLLLAPITLALPTAPTPLASTSLLALVPSFGIKAGQNPDGTGNCIGDNGVKIPCACPPSLNTFVSKLQGFLAAGDANGTPISFPTGNDTASQKTRIQASIVTLQNLNGKGVGCPAASTTFKEQLKALG